MKFVPPNVQAARASREGVNVHLFYWIAARNRNTNAVETMGLWTGADAEQITIEGSLRTFYGAGSVVQSEPLTCEVGIQVRTTQVHLAIVTPEVAQLIRVYDVRHAPVFIWRGEHDRNNNLMATPQRVFEGQVNGSPIPTPAIGSDHPGMVLRLVSSAVALTRFGVATMSDAYQSKRSGDKFLRYASVAGLTDETWGEKLRQGDSANQRSIPSILKGAR